MKIHEYQGKEILRQFGVPVPRGIPAFTVQEAVEAAQKLGGPVWVVKAQIHAGGRGKGGGVKVAKSIDQVKELAGQILGMQLKTHQTGPEGQKVRRLYIEEGADIKKEYYVSIVTDRASQKVALIASSEGGMDIEEVAHKTPEKIITELIDPLAGLGQAQALKVAQGVGLSGKSAEQAADVFQKIYQCYMATDASLVEINPLNCDSQGHIIALDAKFNFDSNALFRHPEIVALMNEENLHRARHVQALWIQEPPKNQGPRHTPDGRVWSVNAEMAGRDTLNNNAIVQVANDAARAILATIEEHPGITRPQLAARLIGPAPAEGNEPAPPENDCDSPVALLPGLVNAHTHLELSWMAGRVAPAESFVDWIRALMAVRMAAAPAACASPCQVAIVHRKRSGRRSMTTPLLP